MIFDMLKMMEILANVTVFVDLPGSFCFDIMPRSLDKRSQQRVRLLILEMQKHQNKFLEKSKRWLL